MSILSGHQCCFCGEFVSGEAPLHIMLDLPRGGTIAAIITNQSSTDLGIAIGSSVTAIFKASSVILGVPA